MNDSYLQYNLEDFLNDKAFISFVNREAGSNLDIWNNWLTDHPEKAVIAKEAVAIIKSLEFEKESLSEDKIEGIWNNIQSSISLEKNKVEPKLRKLSIRSMIVGVAATIALLLIANIFWNPQVKTTTNFAEFKNITLPDQSTAHLNADSKIVYATKDWNNERNIELTGEAFFDVQKGTEFSVTTDNIIVQVLGTSFNVFNRGDIVDVRCESGKVNVINKLNSEAFLLTPGLGVRSDKRGGLKTYNFDVHLIKDWQDGIIQFENQPLKVVFEALERQFDVSIQNTSVDLDRKYTGQFESKKLEKALHSICWPMKITYSVNDKNINIH